MDKRFFYLLIIVFYLFSVIGNIDNLVRSDNVVINYFRFYSRKGITSFCYDTKRDNFLVSLLNKTILLYHIVNDKIIFLHKKYLNQQIVKSTYVSSLDVFILVSDKGNLYIFDPQTLRLIREENILEKGEIVFTFTVTKNGKYLVLGLKIQYKGVTVDRLVVISLKSFKRLFVWDIYSKPTKLVQLFFLKSYLNDLIVIEYIDTICELCELTEARIAIFNVTSRKILYEKMVGLSVINIDENNRKLTVVRYSQDMRDLSCPYTIIDTNKWSEINGKVYGKIISVASYGDKLFFLYKTNAKNKEEYILESKYNNGKTYSKINFSERGLLGLLDNYLVLATISRIRIFSGNQIVKSIIVNNTIPPRAPEMYIKPRNDLLLVKFGSKLIYILQAKRNFNLFIYVYDSNNNPLRDANVTITLSNGKVIKGKTSFEGIYQVKVTAGETKIEINAKGYVYEKRKIFVYRDSILKIYLKREVQPKSVLIISIVDKDDLSPIRGALVQVINNNVSYYSAVSDDYGVVRFEDIDLGKYLITVRKDEYFVKNLTILLDKNVMNITIPLRRKMYNVTVNIVTNYTKLLNLSYLEFISIANNSIAYKIDLTREKVLIKNIMPGIYDIKIKSSYCPVEIINDTDQIVVSKNVIFSIVVSCKKNLTKNNIIDPQIVINIINNTIQFSKKLNYTFKSFFASTPDGKKVEVILDNSSRITIIEFFYTRCEGCKYLIPVFKDILKNETLKENVKIYSLTVNPSDNEYLIELYKKEYNIPWTILKDSENIYSKLNISSYPTVLVVYKGKIIYIGIGAKEELTNISKFEEFLKVISSLYNFIYLLIDNIGLFFILFSLIIIMVYRWIVFWDKKYFNEE